VALPGDLRLPRFSGVMPALLVALGGRWAAALRYPSVTAAGLWTGPPPPWLLREGQLLRAGTYAIGSSVIGVAALLAGGALASVIFSSHG